MPTGDEPVGKRRRRAPVDYASLNAQLEAELGAQATEPVV